MNANASGFNRLERGFIAEPGNAPAGAFGRRVYGRPAPAPAPELEVETILARCRSRRADTSLQDDRRERERRGSEDMIAYVATGLSLIALSAISALPMF